MSESNESNLRALKRLVREPWDDVIDDAIKTEMKYSAALARIAELEAETRQRLARPLAGIGRNTSTGSERV